MSSESSDQRDLSLPEGVLRLTSLNKDRLILAELANGTVTQRQLRKALGEAGVKHGIIERGVKLILTEHDGQVPIARAEILDLPAQTTDVGLDLPVLEEVLATGKLRALEQADVSYPVKAGQSLLTVDSAPKTVLRYPQGNERVLHEHDGIDPKLFAGENTEVGQGGQEIIAAIDGLAQRSIYGKISVYPSERSGGIGKAHGKLYKETALAVEQDISDGADIETVSTLTVRGAVHGAMISVGGNLQVQYAVDNRTRNKEAKLVAGQSLRVRSIEHTPVWVGANFVSTQGILHCDVQCMDTIAATTVAASQLSVGHRLIVGDVTRHSVINLGVKFVSDPRHRGRLNAYNQDIKLAYTLEQRLDQHRVAYDKTRETLVRQIDRMRDPAFAASQRQKATRALIRLYNDLEESVEEYRKKFRDYQAIHRTLNEDQVGLKYYAQRLERFAAPYILAFGKLDTGTQIQGPVDRIVLKEPLPRARISLDPITGNLVMESQGEKVAKELPA